MLLDPTLPEKQRARRRLVGAIALVIAAVVILPMVLDSHPKPVTDDISINIPSRPLSRSRVADADDTQAGVAPDNPAAPEASLAASGLAPTAPATSAPTPPATAQRSATAASTPVGKAQQQSPAVAANTPPSAKPASKAATAPAKPSTPPPAAETTDNTTTQSAAAAHADPGTPVTPPGSRFAVQLGSFSDDASARNWATKLKAAGVPAYIERHKQSDGSSRTLLRAGPFADRAAASAAIAKVREAGLTSGANNGSAQ